MTSEALAQLKNIAEQIAEMDAMRDALIRLRHYASINERLPTALIRGVIEGALADAPRCRESVERRQAMLAEFIEAAFWRFDARRKGYGEWKETPQSERDAFKAECFGTAATAMYYAEHIDSGGKFHGDQEE